MIALYQRQKKYPCKPLKEANLAMSPSNITSKSNLPTTTHYKLDETWKAIAPAPYTLLNRFIPRDLQTLQNSIDPNKLCPQCIMLLTIIQTTKMIQSTWFSNTKPIYTARTAHQIQMNHRKFRTLHHSSLHKVPLQLVYSIIT